VCVFFLAFTPPSPAPQPTHTHTIPTHVDVQVGRPNGRVLRRGRQRARQQGRAQPFTPVRRRHADRHHVHARPHVAVAVATTHALQADGDGADEGGAQEGWVENNVCVC
jgi:hypothetical protein